MEFVKKKKKNIETCYKTHNINIIEQKILING